MATGTVDLYVRSRAGKAALNLAAGPEQRLDRARSVQRPSQRQPELDALRGVMLLWMTVTHLPTHASHYSYQPLGFVAAAEGFIFISALLAGKSFAKLLETTPFTQTVQRIWARAGKLYAYHLFLLGIAFTAVAAVASHTGQSSLQGLLDFYLAHRLLAIVSSVMLVYCPPLLDILPTYIIFLLATPAALFIGRRWGWRFVLIPSGLLWTGAQFGLRQLLHSQFVQITGFEIPLQSMGAFDLFAWQLLWAVGLWLGGSAPGRAKQRLNSPSVAFVAAAIASIFLVLRYALSDYTIYQSSLAPWLDKWHLGPLRLINFAALAILFAAARPLLKRWGSTPQLVMIGKASLKVFAAHLLFIFAALTLVNDGTGLGFGRQAALIAFTLAGVYVVAFVSGRPWQTNRLVRTLGSARLVEASGSQK